MNRRWICNDVWMDIFPSFDHAQLGLKLALLSPRFNALVDKHFDGKKELTIWRTIEIHKNKGPETKFYVRIYEGFVPFPLPDFPLRSKIRFKHLHIEYIDHSVIDFFRSNHQIFDKRGISFDLWIPSSHTTDGQRIWDIFVREIWPIFSTNIHHLRFVNGADLDNLRRRTSSTILTDLNQLNSIELHYLLPDSIGGDFDGPNATISAGQMLSKWLHIPTKDGQPKRLDCGGNRPKNFEWINNFIAKFLDATTSVRFKIQLSLNMPPYSNAMRDS